MKKLILLLLLLFVSTGCLSTTNTKSAHKPFNLLIDSADAALQATDPEYGRYRQREKALDIQRQQIGTTGYQGSSDFFIQMEAEERNRLLREQNEILQRQNKILQKQLDLQKQESSDRLLGW